jgi:hypothetical protein
MLRKERLFLMVGIPQLRCSVDPLPGGSLECSSRDRLPSIEIEMTEV